MLTACIMQIRDGRNVTRAAVEPEFHFRFRGLGKRWLKLVGGFGGCTLLGPRDIVTIKLSGLLHHSFVLPETFLMHSTEHLFDNTFTRLHKYGISNSCFRSWPPCFGNNILDRPCYYNLMQFVPLKSLFRGDFVDSDR